MRWPLASTSHATAYPLHGLLRIRISTLSTSTSLRISTTSTDTQHQRCASFAVTGSSSRIRINMLLALMCCMYICRQEVFNLTAWPMTARTSCFLRDYRYVGGVHCYRSRTFAKDPDRVIAATRHSIPVSTPCTVHVCACEYMPMHAHMCTCTSKSMQVCMPCIC